MQVFISYGKRDAVEFAAELAQWLRQQGHEPWLDIENGIPIGTPFDTQIERGITGSDLVLFVLSPWSIREESFCRKELLYAQASGKRIIPLRMSDVLPPVQIISLSYVDFFPDKTRALNLLAQAIEDIGRGKQVPHKQWANPEGKEPWWVSAPVLNFEEELAKYGGNFVGREWLFTEISQWVANPQSRLLLLTANAGVGKSAIAAQLTVRFNVKGVHFCTRSNYESCKLTSWLAALIYQLSVQTTTYREQIEKIVSPNWNLPVVSLFKTYLSDPLRACQEQLEITEPWVLVIDGLDEAAAVAGSQFIHFLVDSVEHIPVWLRLIVTSRPDEGLLADLRIDQVRRNHLDAEGSQNLEDVRRYIEYRIQKITDNVLTAQARSDVAEYLPELASGNFLFARMTLDALTDPDPTLRLSIADLGRLPEKLGGLYKAMFRKRFFDISRYEERIIPLLNCFVAAYGPLPENLLLQASGLDRRSGQMGTLSLSQFLNRTSQGLRLFHKSFADWLTDYQASAEFCADASSGHKQLADICYREFESGVAKMSPYAITYLSDHLRDAGTWDNLVKVIADLDFLASAISANRMFAIVSCWVAVGNRASASNSYRQAILQAEILCGDQSIKLVSYLRNVGNLLYAMSELREAEFFLRRAVNLQQKLVGDNHPGFAACLEELARLYCTMSSYTTAEPLLRQALDIRRTALGENHPDFAASLDNLASLYQAMGNYAEAKPLHQQALEIRRAALREGHPDLATSLDNLASLYRAMGNYAEAKLLYKQALDIRRKVLEKDHPDFATSLDNLAGLYCAMDDYVNAEPLYQQALDIRSRVLGENHSDFAASLSNLAKLYQSRGYYTTAEPLYQQALKIRRVVIGEKHPDFAQSLGDLAELYYLLGNYAAAESFFLQALEIQRESLGESHPNLTRALNNLAVLYASTGQNSKAMALIQQAAVIDDRMIGQVFSVSSESGRMAYLKTIREGFDLFLSLIYQHLSLSPGGVQAGLDFVLHRKAIGAEALFVQRDAMLGGRYPELQAKLKELSALRIQIAQKILIGPGLEGLQAHQQVLAQWISRKEWIETDLVQQVPEMNLEQKLRIADRQSVALALPEESVLVEFVRFNNYDFKAVPSRGESRWKPARYLAFILLTNEPENVQMIDLGEAEPIDRMVADFRSNITHEIEGSGGRVLEYRGLGPVGDEPSRVSRPQDGSALRMAIFDPLLAALKGRKRVLLALDGDLTRLPFHVLPTDNGGRLIDDYQISYLTVGRDVLRFYAKTSGQSSEPLVIADPDFDLGYTRDPGLDIPWLENSSLRFGRLPGSREEGEQIAAMLGVQPKVTDKALVGLIASCRSPYILHIITHAFFLPDQQGDPMIQQLGLNVANRMSRLLESRLDNPLLRSGLFLAGANTWSMGGTLPAEAGNGLLTAEDVLGLDLLATELVVLSACETGLGEIHVGEGVFGLQRAFALAGAKTLVMSLWKIPDEQTRELMVDFYRNVLAGQPRAEALRQAQLKIKAKYPHPFYWGAFICQGDPRPLPPIIKG